jgi:hypothetical protein
MPELPLVVVGIQFAAPIATAPEWSVRFDDVRWTVEP